MAKARKTKGADEKKLADAVMVIANAVERYRDRHGLSSAGVSVDVTTTSNKVDVVVYDHDNGDTTCGTFAQALDELAVKVVKPRKLELRK